MATLGAGACGYDTVPVMDLFVGAAPAQDGSSPPDGDAGPDALASGDSGASVEGGAGTSTSRLACGGSACSIPAQSCCVDFAAGPPQELSSACIDGSGCPSPEAGATAGQPGVSLKCSGHANCPPSTTCCISKIQSTVFARCTSECGAGEAQLCDPSSASPECPSGSGPCSTTNVSSWGLPGTYGTCGGIAAQ